MPAPEIGPCQPWDAQLCCDLSGVDPLVIADAVQAATEVLWAKSGRQFGVCSAKARPCRSDCAGDGWVPWGYDGVWGSGSPWPYNAGHSQWFNIVCGSCSGDCSCTRVCEFELPGGMVNEITSLTIDGAPLVAGVDYRVDDWRKVVRLGGECWPLCQDMNANDGEVGSWVVEWTYGLPVPTLGEFAVGEMACELARFCDANKCRLPRRTTTVSREGVTYTLIDPFDFFERNRTGLYTCDLFITTTNPSDLTSAPVVWSPDSPGRHRVAGT